jgi:hypothetical protein
MLGCYLGTATTAASGVPDRFLGERTSKDKEQAAANATDKSSSPGEKENNVKESTEGEGAKQVDAMDIDK